MTLCFEQHLVFVFHGKGHGKQESQKLNDLLLHGRFSTSGTVVHFYFFLKQLLTLICSHIGGRSCAVCYYTAPKDPIKFSSYTKYLVVDILE